MEAYQKSTDDLAKELNTNLSSGLSLSEAKTRLEKMGLNVLKEAPGKNPFLMFLSEFKNFLVIILIIASVVSFLLGEQIDALMILAIVIINATVGFIQEYRVEKAIQHLKKMVTSNVLVTREGRMLQLPSAELVPGDLVTLEEGQKIPADIRLISSIGLQTIEASLTGESTPTKKIFDSLSGELGVADQKNMAFCSTIVASGKATGIVIATGMSTQIGKIANLVQSQVDTATPMQIKLDTLGKLIGKIVLVVAFIIALEEFFLSKGESLSVLDRMIESSISAVALAVAAIPEGLPAVVTISLALGTKRLLNQNALIRNLPAAETLGSTDVICCDKTGTLTEGVMSIRQLYLNGKVINFEDNLTDKKNLEKILNIGVLSSNARHNGEKVVGDSTEAALIMASIKAGANHQQLLSDFQRIHEVPFTSDRKMMTTASQSKEGVLITSKGATEAILQRCDSIELDGKITPLTEAQKQEIIKTNDSMASGALRVLAFAFKQTDKLDPNSVEEKLTFLGLQGMMDPPRVGIRETILTCQQQAGIKVIMITGDHLLTAQAIGREIGIADKAITGVELDKLTDEEFNIQVEELTIYARVNPEHKIRIVKALKSHGHQVAMTGDGVNDAPALKAADIGIAMGITGTDVAKDSSDMILLDDHFRTIVAAVREGRAIYDNIRKFVNYLLSTNMMEVGVIFVAVSLGWAVPLLPIHLLWVNLVTDGLPAIALGVDPARNNIMSLKPSLFREAIITPKFFKKLILASLLMTAAILGIFYYYQDNTALAQTMAFTAIVVFEMIRIANIRSEYNLSMFSNKYLLLAIFFSLALQLIVLYLPISIAGNSLQTLFKVQPLSLNDWLILIGASVLMYIIMRLVWSVSLAKPALVQADNQTSTT